MTGSGITLEVSEYNVLNVESGGLKVRNRENLIMLYLAGGRARTELWSQMMSVRHPSRGSLCNSLACSSFPL